MRVLVGALALVVVLIVPNPPAYAQSVEMPVPNLVVKDADKKVMAQVVDISPGGSVGVMVDFGGELEYFNVRILRGTFNNGDVYFSDPGCTGTIYIFGPTTIHSALGLQSSFATIGPDHINGTYRVFRSAGEPQITVAPVSEWSFATLRCEVRTPTPIALYRVDEVLPNPFAGFHGPTDAIPGRTLFIEGGTRLP